MRELKFRAYDFDGQKMIYFEGIFNAIPYREKSIYSQYESIKEPLRLSELMYYVGEDSDRKDMYEGDLISSMNDSIMGRLIYMENEGRHYVDLLDGTFPMPLSQFKYAAMGRLKIIGNVYENLKMVPNND